MENLFEITNIIKSLHNKQELTYFVNEIFTETEIETLSKRWQILKMLKDGLSQRKIASFLNVSLCKVTRGSKILKNNNSIANKYIRGKR